jgi:hypothetical protein
MPQDDSHLLEAIDRKLAALLALATHRLLLEDPELANPRPRSIDQILHDVGLSQGEIANLLGKTPQAVSYMLAKE